MNKVEKKPSLPSQYNFLKTSIHTIQAYNIT